MAGWPILSLTTFLPLVGAASILMVRGEPDVVARNARNIALWTSLATFALSLLLWAGLQAGDNVGGRLECQMREKGRTDKMDSRPWDPES